MSDIEAKTLPSEAVNGETNEQVLQLLNKQETELKDSINIEMQKAENIYPVISGEISASHNVAQPCDTQTTSSRDNDGYNSDIEGIQPLKVSIIFLYLEKVLLKIWVLK